MSDVWPEPTRVYESHHFDSGAWDVINPRKDDIIVATAGKSGTTWVQAIVASLIFQGSEPPASVGDLSFWVDVRLPPRELKQQLIESQATRRFLKTHLPTDALRYSPDIKYVYVARDLRDAFMSLVHHYEDGNDVWYDNLNKTPGLKGPMLPRYEDVVGEGEQGIRDLFDKWMSTGWDAHPWEEDGWPFWSFFHNFESWWRVRSLPNVLLVHFNDLKKDLGGQMRRIAKFLDIEIDEGKFPETVKKCTFEYMKANARTIVPIAGAMLKGGAESFINKGTNERWKVVLSDEQVAAYEVAAVKKCGGSDAAKWLAEGGLIPGASPANGNDHFSAPPS